MSAEYKVVKVALSNTSYNYDIEYSYSIPVDFYEEICEGCRVLVPFGKGNRKRIGLVTRVYFKQQEDPALKPVLDLIDETPCVDEELLSIIRWLKEHTFCTFFEALNTVIPKGLGINFDMQYTLGEKWDALVLSIAEEEFVARISECKTQRSIQKFINEISLKKDKEIIQSLIKKEVIIETNSFKRNVSDETIRMVRLSDRYLTENIQVKLSPKQNQVIAMLEECSCASVKEICYMCNVTSAVVSSLERKGVVTLYDYEVLRTPHTIDCDFEYVKTVLSAEQCKVFNGITELIDKNKPSGALLYGVTGSGKTSVFIKLIEYVLQIGKTAVMLIPEISLTPQTVNKFLSVFGNTIAVIHSNLSLGQRVDEYKRIKSGDAKIVIGTRSAVFAPLKNIGIIIMDEEGERTYKSESSPRYHARDIAVQRCGYHNAVLLMASATPSIESYYYAVSGRYKLFELNNRYSAATLPEVIVVDMQLEAENGNKGIFSSELIKETDERLARKEQVIFLLNRRGYYTYVSCVDCKKPIVCPNCNIAMTYHKPNGLLMCHYCGYSRAADEKCPECGSTHLHCSGTGTQKLEDEIERLFPTARILRMDADTTYSRYSYEKNFKAFGEGEYDIMVGTQMIAKGLDFPNVTLVGVLSLDKALFTGDYRSYERTFSLITQVVGRSGRGDKDGVAFIQTFVPDHYVLNLAAKQDYKAFFEEEIAARKVLVYPPFCDTCVIGLSSLVESACAKASREVINIMKQLLNEKQFNQPLRVLGPSKCTLGKINNKFRYRIIIKCKNNEKTRELVSEILIRATKNKLFSNVSLYADINGDIGI